MRACAHGCDHVSQTQKQCRHALSQVQGTRLQGHGASGVRARRHAVSPTVQQANDSEHIKTKVSTRNMEAASAASFDSAWMEGGMRQSKTSTRASPRRTAAFSSHHDPGRLSRIPQSSRRASPRAASSAPASLPHYLRTGAILRGTTAVPHSQPERRFVQQKQEGRCGRRRQR